MLSDPLITIMKVMVTFYPLLWIGLLFSFIAMCAERVQIQVFSDMNPCAVCDCARPATLSAADYCVCVHHV